LASIRPWKQLRRHHSKDRMVLKAGEAEGLSFGAMEVAVAGGLD